MTGFPPIHYDRLITTAELSKRVKKPRQTIWYYIVHGARTPDGRVIKLRAIRYPGGFEIDPDWWDEFVAQLQNDLPDLPKPAEAPHGSFEKYLGIPPSGGY